MNKEQDKLIEQYLPLVTHILKHYYIDKQDYDDYFQVSCMGLIKAIQNYDPSKYASFKTYAYEVITSQIIKYFNKSTLTRANTINFSSMKNDNKEEDDDLNFTTKIIINDNCNRQEDNLISRCSFIELLKPLNQRKKAILYMKYSMDIPYSEIAKRIGTSRQYVYQEVKKALKEIKKNIEMEEGNAHGQK